MEKHQAKENKLQRDLALNKRKMNEAVKRSEDLRKQLILIKDQATNSSNQMQKKSKIARPMSSNPYKSQGNQSGLVGVKLTTECKPEK